MRVKTDASILLNQLTIISKLVNPTSGNVSLQVKDSNLYLFSVNDMATFQSVVPSDIVEGEASFGVSIEGLKTLLRKRSKVELQYINTMLVVSEKGYRAQLATVDPVEQQALAERNVDKLKGKKWKLSADQSKWLNTSVNEVNLKVVEALSPFMPITVKITDKGAFIACYDNNHMSFIRSKEMTGDLDVTMPASTFAPVLEAFAGSNLMMEVCESALVLKNKVLKISMSLPNVDTYIPVTELLKLANQSLASDHQLLTLNRETLIDFMDSCKAVATKERSELKVKASGKKVVLTVGTIAGNINQNLSLAKAINLEFSLDFSYFQEAVTKSIGEELEIRVIKDSSLIVGAKNGYSIISLFG